MTDDNDYLFDDAAPQATETVEEAQTEVTGEQESTEPPSEEQEEKSESVQEKMIPEHRFKAALREVTEERDALRAEAARLKAEPMPDRNEDPEGYDFRVRMESSRTVMRELAPDYDEVIAEYAELANANPVFNEQLVASPVPAKFAYDLVKRNREIKELMTLKDSDDWKKFQEWKKTNEPPEAATKQTKQIAKSLAASVPNLNRATNAAPKSKVEDDDYLMKGAHF